MLPTRCLIILVLCAALSHAAALNSPAPKFLLNDTHAQRRTLSNYKGKVVFINFWASWCGPCRAELPELNRLAAVYGAKKVQVLAINVDEDPTAAKTLLQQLSLSSPRMEILLDPQSKVVSTFNIESMPSSFILDAQGIIRFTHVGFRSADPSLWHQEIDKLLGEH